MIDVGQSIGAAIQTSAAPWLPELTERLANAGWDTLDADLGISCANYSTARVLRRGGAASLPDEALLSIPLVGSESRCFIEFLPSNIEALFESPDFNFVHPRRPGSTELLNRIVNAFDMIALVPSLYASVTHLVRCVHLLQSRTDEHDVSFSDPAIPFSIFVSIPRPEFPHATLRIAEGVVHEAMHLQLTLFELTAPIAITDGQEFFSPWKQAQRSASGMLHALYVFTVIDEWLRLLPLNTEPYRTKRRREIAEQVAGANAFQQAELTPVGDTLRRHLFFHFYPSSALPA